MIKHAFSVDKSLQFNSWVKCETAVVNELPLGAWRFFKCVKSKRYARAEDAKKYGTPDGAACAGVLNRSRGPNGIKTPIRLFHKSEAK